MKRQETVHWNEIGLVRGLFWQPARVEMLRADEVSSCDLLGTEQQAVYTGFRKEKFGFTVPVLWPHPHGAMTAGTKKGALEWKFAGFRTTAPAWTLLSEFVVPRRVDAPDAKEGSTPAGPVAQADAIGKGGLHLLVGGYRVKQSAVEQRRHELMSLAQGWNDDKKRLEKLVDLGKKAKSALRGRLYLAVKGDKSKGLKGIGADIHETGEMLFYAHTEALIHETFDNGKTFGGWQVARAEFARALAETCRSIFEELTGPYALKPELIPVIAWARRSLNTALAKLMEETST